MRLVSKWPFQFSAGSLLVLGIAAVLAREVRDHQNLYVGVNASEQQANDCKRIAAIDLSDFAEDGTPGFLRLDDEPDQEAFRRWFTFLAELQHFTPATRRPAEIVDCAALIRYAYREALRNHDNGWAATSRVGFVPAVNSIRKYEFPRTPLGASLFRLTGGPFVPADLHNGAFAQFANAESIQRFNTFFISRNVARAKPGDLLFYRRAAGHMPFHSMIFVGHSRIKPDSLEYVVYHTGPIGTEAGTVRRLSVAELLHFPDSQWQPRATNPAFLGVFRWNILRTTV